MKGAWCRYKTVVGVTASIFFWCAVLTSNRVLAQELGTWQKLTPPSEWLNVITTTPWAIYAGQAVDRYGGTPSYNGVFVSTDLGITWQQSGLIDRGVRDLKYSDGKLYAATYLEKDGETGLFVSEDRGSTWQHKGPSYSLNRIFVAGQTILLGTTTSGLWRSTDGGVNYVQKIGTQAGSIILGVNCNQNVCLAGVYAKAHISTDLGETWAEMPDLAYTSPQSFAFGKNVMLAGTKDGLYTSYDTGKSWAFNTFLGTNEIGDVFHTKGRFYASKREADGKNTLFVSDDLGNTWASSGLVLNKTGYPLLGLSWAFSNPSYIFASGYGNGISRYAILPKQLPANPFLAKLWNRSRFSEQTDSITSYFDHTYPFLSYLYKTEPLEERGTTTNFYGEKAEEPALYYSAHDGVDFGLKYGTPILAPHSGYASYSYSQLGGHTIKVDHTNGYETLYLHLQSNGLAVKSTERKWVEEGAQLGLVGLTGNTTGPHLHFGVRKDKNNDGDFTNDVPEGLVDPYSWLDEFNPDPWEGYTWEDTLGTHQGSQSKYLWQDLLEPLALYTKESGGSLNYENVTVSIPNGSLAHPITAVVEKIPRLETLRVNSPLKYIQNTSVRIKFYDYLQDELNDLTSAITLTFDLSNSNLADTLPGSYIIKRFDRLNKTWESIPSMWNETTKQVSALVDHLSDYAVFGEKSDPTPPVTTIVINGERSGLWYKKYPTVALTALDGDGVETVDRTFYSLNEGLEWEEYINAFDLTKDGVYDILFRSSDASGNYEDAKDSPLLRVNTLNGINDESAVKGAAFQTSIN